MSAKHRKSAKRIAATRAATAAGAVAATAGLAMATPPVANAAAPDYSQFITNMSDSTDNFLHGTNSINQGVQNSWNPIAEPINSINPLAGLTGNILPTFTGDYYKDNLLDLSSLSGLTNALRSIANMGLPTDVPGVVPNVVIPLGLGGGSINPSDYLPKGIPGGDALTGLADGLDGLLATDLGLLTVGDIVSLVGGQLPPLNELINGLELTHSQFTSGFDWGLIASGNTQIQNFYLQTPGTLSLDLTSLPGLSQPVGTAGANLLNSLIPGLGNLIPGNISSLTGNQVLDALNIDLSDVTIPGLQLPSLTAWVPQGSGNYTILGSQAGWWATAPTVSLDVPAIPGVSDGTQLVVSIPVTAAGFALPMNLASVGNLSASVLVPTDNGVWAPAAINMFNVNTFANFGVTNLNITTNNYIGTNGININNGQNVLLLQNPFLPIPIVYSLGGFNIGPSGAGIYMPSLFGVSLLPDLQLGTAPGPELTLTGNPAVDDILDGVLGGLTSNPLLPTSLVNVTGLLNLNGFITQGEDLLTPVYLATAGTLMTPISNWATDQYGPAVDNLGSNILKFSQFYDNTAGQIGGGLTNLGGAIPLSQTATTQQAGTFSEENPSGSPEAKTANPIPHTENNLLPTTLETGSGGGSTQNSTPPNSTPPSNDPPSNEAPPTDGPKHEPSPGRPSVSDIIGKVSDGVGNLGSKLTDGPGGTPNSDAPKDGSTTATDGGTTSVSDSGSTR